MGSSDEPIWIAVSGSAVAFRPTTRLIQPTRAEEPGSASSTSIIDSKWLRLGAGRPTAWTAPNVPACPHRQQRGERRVQAEVGVAADQRALGHHDAGPGRGEQLVVGAARHHHRQSVGAAAQAEQARPAKPGFLVSVTFMIP